MFVIAQLSHDISWNQKIIVIELMASLCFIVSGAD